MALTHAQPGEVVSVLPAGESPPKRTHALFKAQHLEVLRLVLKTGDRVPPHKVAGEITVQCVAGRLELGHPGGKATLANGELVYLAAGALHDVHAVEDCVALVTISLNPP